MVLYFARRLSERPVSGDRDKAIESCAHGEWWRARLEGNGYPWQACFPGARFLRQAEGFNPMEVQMPMNQPARLLPQASS